LVNAAKFKAHTWLKVTFALKNYIGIQDDAHRLIDHDHKLVHKITDLQEVIRPGFIAIDGITAGEYSEINASPFPLGLIIMGLNPVAVDVVCTSIVGLEPSEVDYIRLAAERGYGPLDLGEIEVTGDVTLEEAQDRAQGFSLTLDRVDEYLNGRSNLTAYVGPPPDTYEYCSGGCPGALVFATQILEAFQPDMHQQVRPMSFIFGSYQGEIHPREGERILAMGDCAEWSGQIGGKDVEIRAMYVPREERDPHKARMKDAVGQILAAVTNVIRQRRQPVMRIPGCPVAVMQYLWYLSLLGRTVNPTLHPRILPVYAYHYVVHKVVRTARWITAALRGWSHRQTTKRLSGLRTDR
jgi:hypothetical protein